MPIYEYRVQEGVQGCSYCTSGFERLERMSDTPLSQCPKCGVPVVRLISAPTIGRSRSGFDDRARSAGFHKFQRLGKGEYEMKY